MDSDYDGQSNWFEFLAGYVPTDAASRLVTQALDLNGPTFTMELSRVQPGTRYTFYRTTDFETWTPVFTLEPEAIWAPFTQALPAVGTSCFFCVELSLP